jgi:hypothetical protein
MVGAYASFLLCLGASTAIGAAILVACGRRRWSRLAPAVGLAALCPLAWWTVRMPGEGTTAAIVIGVTSVACGVYALPRVRGLRGAVRRGVPIELAAVALASLPFIVEWRFGVLGTGLNPDMSQHLFAVDRLVDGGSERLISSGYPLGPHSIVAALAATGPSTVHAFDGLTLAVTVIACLAALALLERLSPWRRATGALLVAFAYLAAAYLAQGAFKETMQALFVLAFAVGLAELIGDTDLPVFGRRVLLRGVPLAVLATGSLYAYSFPGILWLGGAFGVWAAIELVRPAAAPGRAGARQRALSAAPAVGAACALVVIAALPEVGRMIDFAKFESFDPAGAGLGNLFNRLSPLEALGIWPSGDFRLEPGGGAVPAAAFYLGAALAAGALAYGLLWWLRRGERAVPAALLAAVALWLYALIAGTPYQEAKALVMVAPLAMLISVRAILERAPTIAETRTILRRRSIAFLFPGRRRDAKERLVAGALGALFVAGAALSSILALVNAPVGPSGYSPALYELAPKLGTGSVLVIAPPTLLEDEHGADWIAWELRGNRVCVAAQGEATPTDVGASSELQVGLDEGAVVPQGAYVNRSAGAPGDCPLIPDAARADPSAGG